MERVFPALREALARGERAALCGVIESSGSTPRGPGARMAVFADGSFAGTIGGGSVERLAQDHARALLAAGRAEIRRFQLYPGGEDDTGMICGGTVAVAFQILDQADRGLVERICALQAGEEPAWLVTAMPESGPWTRIVWTAEGLRAPEDWAERVRGCLGRKAVLAEGEPPLFVEPLAGEGTVYIFGAGHVGVELAWVLDRVGLRLAVFDERPEALRPENFPAGVRLILGDYGHIGLPLTAVDAAVIMTAGHQGDLTLLEQVLRTPADYIGCIGSRKKAAAARERLREKGFSQSDIARVHSPIGLPIGGETPAEIAVSVAAELIAHRAGKELSHG